MQHEHRNFIWDHNKADENVAKHGFSFDDGAAALLLDSEQCIQRDPREYQGEVRFRTVARGEDGRELMIVWTPREGMTRIISVRRANPKERRHE